LPKHRIKSPGKRHRISQPATRGRAVRLLRILVLALLIILITPVVLMFAYQKVTPPITPLMMIRLFEGEGIEKKWVPLRRISPNIVRTVVALEDVNYCQHSGVDWGSFFEALSDHFKGKRLRGASTISMQTTKNLFLWPGRDYVRKGIEAPLTMLMEWMWNKRRIMEVYLNIVEWGPGIYGVEAASRAYFKKPAAKLTPWEAGLLAAVLPNPRKWSAGRPTAYIRNRAQTALARATPLSPAAGCARVIRGRR
jgi:monofunctional biosynthetic peptidoglycan transglycosylase